MNLLNLSDLDNRPFLKYIIIMFIAVNAVVLAMLLFGPGRLFPAASTASGGSGNSSASSGITSESAEENEENREDEEDLSEDKDRDSEQNDGEDDADEAALGNTQEEELSDTSDEASEESSEGNTEESETREDGPVLELVSDHVTLKVGSNFNFYDYIKTMVDSNGASLSQYIHLDGQVNTYAPGDYTITYKITSPITGITAAKDLLVTVEN